MKRTPHWFLLGLVAACWTRDPPELIVEFPSYGGFNAISAGAAGAASGAAGAPHVGGGGGSTDAGSTPSEAPLPPGSREFESVVNLVDAAAAQELADFFRPGDATLVFLRHELTKSLNLFLEYYEEEYDFVYFFTDRLIEGAPVAGKFEAITQRAAPGGGNDIEIAASGYRTSGRIKGVAGFQYMSGVLPPLGHETAHYWANFLDRRLGFGSALDVHYDVHWGYSDVNGQLGGYDGTTLLCEKPSGALPPSCQPNDAGRYQYVVSNFAPNTNSFRRAPYSPLELYLMGLLPPEAVPRTFQLMTDARFVPGSYVDTTGTVVVEATGIETLPFTDILARHGQVQALAPAERNFKAAFVVISEEPAADAVLQEVAKWAAVFGHRDTVPGWDSFQTLTGNRATMTTLLGPWRDPAKPLPAPREQFYCDAVAQDCGRPELGCYIWPPSYCALQGKSGRNQPCDSATACAAGLACVAGGASPNAYLCQPYCSLNDAASPKSCTTLCPKANVLVSDTENRVWGAVCLAE